MAKSTTTVCWVGEDGLRTEVARVEDHGTELVADGMQVGATYGLRYRLEPGALTVQLLGEQPHVIELDEGDFFDLAWSPLFNSLPVLRDGLMQTGPARSYRMRWVDVPSLAVSWSQQRYEPYGLGLVGFRAGDFTAQIQFGEDGLVHNYPGIARRVA
jgi:hypothetical protein